MTAKQDPNADITATAVMLTSVNEYSFINKIDIYIV